MSAKDKKSLVPRLRFPEFRDAGEWKVKKLGTISKIVRGGSPRPINQYLTNDEDGLNWLKIGDINKDSKYIIQTRERVEKTALAKTRLMKPGDLIMSNSMSFGRPYILKIKTCIHDGWIAITIDEDIDSDYLYYFILSDLSQTYFLNSAAGSGVKNLNIEIVKQLSIFFSYKKEQQKIAACLTALDDLISAATGRLDALKQHKQGLMQQLFPAQGETVPRLRFAEFRDSEEWEVKEVGEIFTVTRGYVLSMNLINNQISDATPYPVYSSQTKNNGLSGYYSEFLYEDAITWTTDGANAGDVNYRSGKFYCTNVCGVLINTEGYTNLCVASLIDRVAKNHVSYVGNPKLMNGIMRKIKIPIPSFAEQQKIAACLTALDDLISAQAQKIAKLKTHKRGLMQQLFPDVDEMN